MFCRRIFGALFLLLVLGGFFGLVNNNAGQDAYTQGYLAGQQSVTGGEDGGTAVTPPPTAPQREFSFFRGLFKLFLFFFGFMFFIGIMSKAFGGKHHRRHHKSDWNHDWGSWHKNAGKPPWYDQDDSDEPVMKA